MTCNSNTGTYTPYNEWNKMTYNNEPFTTMGEMPAGGSWPLNFFKRVGGRFENLEGKPMAFKIKTPDYFDKFWQEQLPVVIEARNNITDQQKKIAEYWGKGEPHNQFMPILQTLINTYKLEVVEAARLYDIVNRAMSDASVMCWHFKYAYQVPRPVQYCKNFESYLPTPQHPSYPAGHSVIPGCFTKIVAHFFPKEKEKLYEILEECSFSRLYAGVHYPLDITEGNKLGEDIGEKILEQLQGYADMYGAWVDKVYEEFKDAPIKPIINQDTF